MERYCYLLVILFFFCCCTKSDLEKSLDLAGENRAELEKVLEHYKNDTEDSLKLLAAKYLIENMDAHYSCQSVELDRYYVKLDSIFRLNSPDTPLTPRQDSLLKALTYPAQGTFAIVPDIKTISAKFLINNIESAFEAWKSPFARKLNFGEFCEYLLPYRAGHEKIVGWRSLYKATFSPFLKSYSDTVCRLRNNLLDQGDWSLEAIPKEQKYASLPSRLFRSASEFTVCGWVKPDRDKVYARFFDFGKDDSYYICFVPCDGNRKSSLRLRTRKQGEEQILEGEALPANRWAHVAVVLKGGFVSLYINGKRANSQKAKIDPQVFSRNYIAKSQFDHDPYFEGEINGLQVYKKGLAHSDIVHLASSKSTQSISSGQPDLKIGFKSPPYDKKEYRVLSPDLFSHSTEFTACGWIEPSVQKTYSRFFDFGQGDSQYICFVASNGNGSNLTVKGRQPENAIIWADSLPVGKKSHVAVASSHGYVYLYMNGKLINTKKVDIDLPKFTRNYVGKSQFDQDPNFEGKISDFRVYGRMLNYAEIKVLAGRKTPSPTENLQAVLDRIRAYYNRILSRSYLVREGGYDPSLLLNLKTGSCNDYSLLGTHVFRSVGIPCAIDFSQQAGHDWNALIFDNKNYDCSFIDDNDTVGKHIKGYKRIISDKMSKVFRHTYAKQKDLPAMSGSKENYPGIFKDPCLKDVTGLYLACSDVSVKLNNAAPEDQKYVYLYNFQREWVAVHWSRHKSGRAVFTKMGRGVVYLPAYYSSDNRVYPAAYPFILGNGGDVHTLKPNPKLRQKLVLVRKYPEKESHKKKRLLGAAFQLAQKPDFSDAVTIHSVETQPEIRYNHICFSLNRKYRYFRFVSPPKSNGGEISEIDLFGVDGKKIKPSKVLGNADCAAGRGLESVFDGDPLTSYWCNKKDDGWVGLDFGQPVSIQSLRFLPLNDDNFIKENESYELFYWNNKWVSLGKRTGTDSQYLEYSNAPTNSLFWLRNLTKGSEERIFTYGNGKQVWW